jgi:metal-responsive CopG/Arc/MetJ family transcriptional regulator
LVIHWVLQEAKMVISVRLDAKLNKRVAALAKARGISKSELIRTCLDKYLASEEEELTAWDLGKHLFGRFNSGRSDLSARAEELAREHVHARQAKKNRG